MEPLHELVELQQKLIYNIHSLVGFFPLNYEKSDKGVEEFKEVQSGETEGMVSKSAIDAVRNVGCAKTKISRTW